MADEITLTLDPPYIGSAYSPQVTVEEIEGGHAVTITSDVPGEGIVAQTFDVMDGDASQAIEDAEAAAAAARAAASSASSAATSATNAAGAASTAAGQATTAAGAATDAASAATGAAASASAAAADATEAAGLADDATAAATAAASNAGTATREAIAATTAANNAAATANAAAGTATIAAADATTAAGTATDAATSATSAASAAGTAATAANDAATAANAAAEAATEAAESITDAWLPRVTVGASDGITGGGPLDTAAWIQRACPGSDGPARIESIHGNTVVQDGELQPVRMTGVESVGFNQWDEQWELGNIDNATGELRDATNCIRSKNLIDAMPSTVYYFRNNSGTSGVIHFYDSELAHLGYDSISTRAFTTPAGTRYLRFRMGTGYGTTYKHDLCINLSGPRNGEYEPYWRYQRAIDAGVLRGAGSVYDELTADERIVRVGEVDLGTLTWSYYTAGDNPIFYANVADAMSYTRGQLVNAETAPYPTGWSANARSTLASRLPDDSCSWIESGGAFVVRDDSYTSAADFKAAMSGVMLHYALATPTTTPIDPPLNMTYKAAAGGTERITHTDPTAAPTLVVQYGSTADGIRDRALACIAEHDGPIAQTYHAVGTYLTMGGSLYKVTTAIAAGERITSGTNVTATTVMAEVLALTQ